MKIGFTSLGCSKNLIDSEKMVGMTNSGGHKLVHNVDETEAIIINMYGSISSVKEEAVQTIFQMAEYKKYRYRKLIAVGYLAQYYKEQLEQGIPEIDIVISIREYPHLYELLPKLLDGHDPVSYDKCGRRVSNKPWTTYLKVVEGCSDHYTYCAVPLICRDDMSFPIGQLVEEVKQLTRRGVRELMVIVRDTAKYGVDPYGRRALLDLLQQLHEIEGFHWIHILYTYPDEIDTQLIEGMAKLPKVPPYFDIPMQHASSHMLQLVDCRGNGKEAAALVKRIRETSSYPTLRTASIVGFSTEGEADFSELMQFVEDIHWDRTRTSPYSPEENTSAYSMDGAVDEDVKEVRPAQLMERQGEISLENQRCMVGEIVEALVEDQEGLTGVYRGCGADSAPDEVDGIVVFRSGRFVEFGSSVKVRIIAALPYDFKGVKVC